MKVIKLDMAKEKPLIRSIIKGSILIYPTDTIYGLGCNALMEDSVKRIREVKKSNKPFSIIAPSKRWIYNNLYAKSSYIEKLPGPFTYILKTRRKGIVSKEVTSSSTLGVRIPDHRFIEIIQKANVPFVTTSVNVSGKKPATSIKEIPKQILANVDIVIDAGVIKGNPSTVIDLTSKVAKIIRADAPSKNDKLFK